MATAHGDQIIPHLYRVAWWDLVSNQSVNCDVYAIDCGESLVLIDSGRGGPSHPLVKANLQHWGLWGRPTTCLLTHMHRDHAGGVAQLRAEGISIWAGCGSAAYSRHEEARKYWADQPIPPLDRVLTDGECFTVSDVQFEILDTPGHTSTCVCYFATIDGLRCAFTGDLVMPNGTIGSPGSFDFNADQLLASIRRVSERDFDAVLTGHTLWSTQPEGFWLHGGKDRVFKTLQAGIEGKWNIPK